MSKFKLVLFRIRIVGKRRSSFLVKFSKEESGSISLLIIGFFIAALMALMVITDVAVVANAKRSLDQGTEAASMRAVHNLDENTYYRRKHNILLSAWNVFNNGAYFDERVPIDCEKGREEAFKGMSSWFSSSSNLKTFQIESYQITSYECEFDVVRLQSSAVVKLPFPAPFTDFDRTTVHSSITTLNRKSWGLYIFGVRVH